MTRFQLIPKGESTGTPDWPTWTAKEARRAPVASFDDVRRLVATERVCSFNFTTRLGDEGYWVYASVAKPGLPFRVGLTRLEAPLPTLPSDEFATEEAGLAKLADVLDRLDAYVAEAKERLEALYERAPAYPDWGVDVIGPNPTNREYAASDYGFYAGSWGSKLGTMPPLVAVAPTESLARRMEARLNMAWTRRSGHKILLAWNDGTVSLHYCDDKTVPTHVTGTFYEQRHPTRQEAEGDVLRIQANLDAYMVQGVIAGSR